MLRIKELREEKNWQQKDVAVKLNRTAACISSWETGKTEPSIDDILKLADLFGVSCDYLLGRTDESGIVNSFSPMQNQLLSLYQSLSLEEQYRVLGFVQALA